MKHTIEFCFPDKHSRKEMKRYHKDLGERVLEIFNSDQVPELFKSYVAEILEESDFPFEIRTIAPLTQKALDLFNDDQVPKGVKVYLQEIIEDAGWGPTIKQIPDVKKKRKAKG
jgi:hypothetical protein